MWVFRASGFLAGLLQWGQKCSRWRWVCTWVFILLLSELLFPQWLQVHSVLPIWLVDLVIFWTRSSSSSKRQILFARRTLGNIVISMNMHPKGSARFLCGSTVVAHMHKPREMDLSMSAHSCLVLVTEATLQAAISEIGQTLQKKTCKQRHSFPRGSCSRTPEIVSTKSGWYQRFLTFQSKLPNAKEHTNLSKSVYSFTSTNVPVLAVCGKFWCAFSVPQNFWQLCRSSYNFAPQINVFPHVSLNQPFPL